MKILLVIAHGRLSSLTRQAAEAFATSAKENGHIIEVADLVAEKFDPVLLERDEPDWDNENKIYSDEVLHEMERIERNDATVVFFPVWWWSVPAILKGWIDRVWNYGWAYGSKNYPHDRVLMVGIGGGTQDAYRKKDYDKAMQITFKTGVLEFCGVPNGDLKVLYGATEGGTSPAEIIASAKVLGKEF